MPVLRGRWCPSCGSAVGWHDEVCGHCGMPLEEEWVIPPSAVAEAAAQKVEETGSEHEAPEETVEERDVAQIESAIPGGDDPTSKVAALEVIPRTSRFLVAAVASIIFVCGVALAITHPWDADAYSIKATKEKDTSMAGFPGTVESLSGQDSDEDDTMEIVTEEDALYAELTDAYEKLGRYAQRADESRTIFDEAAFGDDADARTNGRREVEALAIDVSNVIESLGELEMSSDLYAEDKEHLLTLGNWLRNRVDALNAAWAAVEQSSDPAADREQIEALLPAEEDGQQTDSFKKLFDENYESWKPEHKGAEESGE